MQPILAESVPHRARATALLGVLTLLGLFLFTVTVPHRHHSRHREHHQLPRLGKCANASYVVITR